MSLSSATSTSKGELNKGGESRSFDENNCRLPVSYSSGISGGKCCRIIILLQDCIYCIHTNQRLQTSPEGEGRREVPVMGRWLHLAQHHRKRRPNEAAFASRATQSQNPAAAGNWKERNCEASLRARRTPQ